MKNFKTPILDKLLNSGDIIETPKGEYTAVTKNGDKLIFGNRKFKLATECYLEHNSDPRKW